MTSAVASDRLKAFVDLLVDSLDDLAAGAELAARADLSRYHFQRLVGAALGETPGAFRRRLLLERAAWELREGATVTEAAFTAGYGSTGERFERSDSEFAAVVEDIRERGAWDTAFVDAVCDPHETFTFGAMVSHVLTWSAHRRFLVIGALRHLGADVRSGDPIEWEHLAA